MSTNNEDGGAKSAGQAAVEDGRLVIGNKAEDGGFSIGADGKPEVIDGTSADLDLTQKDVGEEPAAEEHDNLEEGADDTTKETEEPAGDLEDDLGEWKADDEAVVSKFDAKYLNEDGTLNETAIGTEFWTDYAKLSPEDRAKADLRPATRAYLRDTFKVSDNFIDQTRDGLVALQKQNDAVAMEAFGGEAVVTGALNWAREGGYSEEQRARFNAAQAKGGEEFKEAMELLLSRHQNATGGKGGEKRDLPGRRSTPAKNATANAAPGGSDGKGLFKDKGEYQKSWTDALVREKTLRKEKGKSTAAFQAWKEAEAAIADLRKKGRQSAKFWR